MLTAVCDAARPAVKDMAALRRVVASLPQESDSPLMLRARTLLGDG